jgi:hypothetical protein
MAVPRPIAAADPRPSAVGSSRRREDELRRLTEREAVEVLAHQLDIERRERVRVQVGELLVTAVLLGAVFGGSYAVVRGFKIREIRRGFVRVAGGRRRSR